MNNKDFRELLSYHPRLEEWYNIGPVQRCELEAFVSAALQAGITGVTADGELVSPGDKVWVISSTGKAESTTVQQIVAVTGYYLFGEVPVNCSFSTKKALQQYQKENPR